MGLGLPDGECNITYQVDERGSKLDRVHCVFDMGLHLLGLTSEWLSSGSPQTQSPARPDTDGAACLP